MSAPFALSAVDLFAGTGWGVACQWLGIEETGVELMPEARATREANGMHNWLADVWDVLETAPADSPEFRAALFIASPPCQTFSMAGSGKGRQALDEVVGLIDSRAYLDPAKLREFGEAHDMRTALVLTPLTYVARHSPMYVVLEQVPPVLPVWERYAVELRKWGYSAWAGTLNAEQYGVPQTRKRAVLIARADGIEAAPPTPTHSRYYSRDPKRLDPGVLPWVSMAEALGWGMSDKPIHTLTAGTHGAPDPYLSGGRSVREALLAKVGGPDWVAPGEGQGWGLTHRPAVAVGNAVGRGLIGGSGAKGTILDAIAAGEFIDSPHGDGSSYAEQTRITVEEAAALQSYPVMRSQYNTGHGERAGEPGERHAGQPAPTMTSKAQSNQWTPEEGARYFHPMSYGRRGIWPGDEPAPTIRGVQRDMPENYEPHPRDAVAFVGHQYPDSKSATKPNERQTRDAELPAPTITSGSKSAQWRNEPTCPTCGDAEGVHDADGFCAGSCGGNCQDAELGRPGVWNTNDGKAPRDIKLDPAKPATTVAAGPRLSSREHHCHGEQNSTSTKVTVGEASALQSYPPYFTWEVMVPVLDKDGNETGKHKPLTKTKAFLQIGNAVPPLLAHAILSTFLPE